MHPLRFALILASALTWSANAFGASGKMFSKGAEVFKLQNEKGRTPEFRVLDDNASEKMLAMAAIAFINSHEEVKPKVPVNDFIDLKVESVKLVPMIKSGDLEVLLKLSGYELQLDRTIKKEKFLAGQPIELVYAPRSKEVAVFNIRSSGKVQMRLDPKTNTLVLQTVHAKMDYDSQFGDSGKEEIRFSGKGIRQ